MPNNRALVAIAVLAAFLLLVLLAVQLATDTDVVWLIVGSAEIITLVIGIVLGRDHPAPPIDKEPL